MRNQRQKLQPTVELWKSVQNTEEIEQPDSVESEANDEAYKYERKSSPTLFVGDQGANKVLHGVKGRSTAAYGWCAEVPDDMYTKGYFYDVCKKVVTPGGLMHILQDILSRELWQREIPGAES